jgi:class 3 adenylate cyclase
MDGAFLFSCPIYARRGPEFEGHRVMFEELWPEIGKAWVTGVLAGGGSILVQWLAPKAARLLRQLRTADHLRLERRLAAIVFADVVGYSRLMGSDEEGTHARLLCHRREIIAPKVRERHGRIVKFTGDGVLAEFGSVVDAVRCALEVQRAIHAGNSQQPQSQRIEWRIGVNLADVIVAPEDVYGHGVNLAARLESLAPPGGICISAEAWRHVRGAIAADFVDLGEQHLKNIADPAHVYAISPAV